MRISVLHYVAKLLGLQFKIEGMPYGRKPQKVRSGLFSQSAQS
jgi:hypothetical protein